MRSFPRHLGFALALGFVSALGTLTTTARAEGIIKNPGDHPKYAVELEPHGILAWDNYYWGGTGFGLGMHAAIPFLDNGPVSTINNNMGIGFGLDYAHFSDNGCGRFGFNPRFCNESANEILVPVYVQWNFFFTKVVGAFGEAGIGVRHNWATWAGACGGFDCSYNTTDVAPWFEAGGRFLFGDSVGLLVRIGYPYMTVGVSILL